MNAKEISIRPTEMEDAFRLKECLMDPNVLRWFPMADEKEIDDAIRVWIGYSKWKAGLTAVWNEVPCGFSVLYLHSFRKIAHQCLFAVVVHPDFHGKGVGSLLLEDIQKLAKETFHIEILHLEVYEGNPAKRLYAKKGFTEYGYDKDFIKEDGKYIGKIAMQKYL